MKDVQDLKPEAENPKDPASKPKKLQAASLQIAISDHAALGAHALRLVTPGGVSGPIWFVVNSDPVVPETEGQHSTISLLSCWPSLLLSMGGWVNPAN